MRAIAKRLVFGKAAPAKGDHRAPPQTKRITFGIVNFKVSFDANWAIVHNRDFGGHATRW